MLAFVSCAAIAVAIAQPYPSLWTPLAPRIAKHGALTACARLSGRYRDMPHAIEDGGHGLHALGLGELLRLARPERQAPSDRVDGEPARPRHWYRAQRARDVIDLLVHGNGAVSGQRGQEADETKSPGAAAQVVPAMTGAASAVIQSRCLRSGDVELEPIDFATVTLQRRDMNDDFPEASLFALRRTGARRVRVILRPAINGDLVAQLDVIEREVAPVGYAPLKRYWLMYPRASKEGEPSPPVVTSALP